VFLVGFLDHDAHLGLRRGARPKFGLEELRVIDESARRTRTTQYPLQMQQKLESECGSNNCSIVTNQLSNTLHTTSQSGVRFNTPGLPGRHFLRENHKDSHVELSQFESVWEFLEHKFARPKSLEKNMPEAHSMRGIHRRWQYLYEADDHMQFTCVLSQVYDFLDTRT